MRKRITRITSAVAVLPPVYELPINMFRWCNLHEVCKMAPVVAQLAGYEYAPTPEDLVHDFAALVRVWEMPSVREGATSRRAKVLKHSFGESLDGTDVPEGRFTPPWTRFVLNIGTPYPSNLFVDRRWAFDTLRAIRMGGVKGYVIDDRRMTLTPDSEICTGTLLPLLDESEVVVRV